MAFRKLSKLEWAVIGVAVAIAAALLIPSPQGVWDGEFPLVIAITESEPLDRDSLLLAMCWSDNDAQEALDNPGDYEKTRFRRPEFNDEGQAVIDVPVSGHIGTRGKPESYNHPTCVVVEYRLAADNDSSIARKRFDIPTGRGPRSITIRLP
jgi:hypothetical protein